MIRALESVSLPKQAALAVFPNASLPDYVDGRLVYDAVPEYFAASALELREQGASIIGGCCGTTPVHIEAIKNAVKMLVPVQKKEIKVRDIEIIEVGNSDKA